MDYTELVAAIKDYVQNDESTFVSHINDFIITAEDRIFAKVQMPAFWNSDIDQVCVDGTAEYTLDAGVIDIFSVRVSEGTTSQATAGVQFGPVRYLLRKDYDFMLEAFPGSSSGKTATITGITKATAAVVSATNTFVDNDLIYIDGVSGLTPTGESSLVNGKFFRVSSAGASSFELKESGTVLNSNSASGAGSGGNAASGFTTGVPEYYSVSSSSPKVSTVAATGTTLDETTTISVIADTSNITIGMKVSGDKIVSGTVVTSIPSSSTVVVSIVPSAIGTDEAVTFAITNPSVTIRLAPAPDNSYPITIDYYGKTVSDSITAGSTPDLPLTTETWISVTAPETLLYGALVEAYTYMKGSPDLITNYEKHFEDSIGSLKSLVEGRTLTDAYRSGQKQTRVQ